MKSFTLDWKGWWLFRSPLSAAAELNSSTAVYAVMGAKLKKVEQGIACTAREPVLFNVHKGGGNLRDHLEKLLKMSLGVFALKRCQEIRKQPIVYAAFLPDDTDLGDLAAMLSLLYGAVPFAPKHHAMPKPYDGEPMRLVNTGRAIGLPGEITFGSGKPRVADADQTRNGEADADAAMSAAIAQEAAVTRTLTREEMQVSGLATERVAKPARDGALSTEKLDKPDAPRPHLVETTRIEKDDVAQGLATERVAKPGDNVTEFVPRPEKPQDELDEAPRT
ncbi:MAG: hypothetical protein HS108_02405 [Planctomycetes bacterium]|nr:hypothetical protein [Planctomycetota bacterium]